MSEHLARSTSDILQIKDYAEACGNDPTFKGNQRSMLSEAGSFLCPRPLTPVPELARPEWFGFDSTSTKPVYYPIKSRYLHHLPSAQTHTHMYAVIDHRNILIRDSYVYPNQLEETGQFKTSRIYVQEKTGKKLLDFALFQPPKTIKKMTTTGYLPLYYNHNVYYHWLIECLPLLIEFIENPDYSDSLLIWPEQAMSFQTDTLEMLGIPKKRVFTQAHEGVIWEDLKAPSFGQISPESLQGLRKFCLDRFQQSPQLQRKIYISRSDANKRRIINENDLLPILEHFGIECLTLTGLSLAEQIKIFSQASLIIGPSGSGLSNTLFAPEGAHLIDLSPEIGVNHCLWLTTAALQQTYSYLTGPVQNATDDFVIAPEQLKKMLQAVL